MDPISFLLLVLLAYFLIKVVPLVYRISVQIFRARKIYKEAMRQFRQDAPSQNHSNRPYEQQSQTRESQTRKRNADGKIFSKDEGEYVDFEEL
ncbi:MAG: DUF4834 family protein [Bacteroidales bacterium]|nr:DUF4834 family protein [Bacteroidales bacterium]